MTPPAKTQIAMWLAELSVITARRVDDQDTEQLRATAYSIRLQSYPADIARHALLVHRWKFFPAWADLEEVCENMIKTRQALARAIDLAERKMNEDLEKREAKARRDAETPEHRAAVAASLGLKRFP